ncbi:MAG: hypothetical protein MOB07_19850 [Acidobacteria bacterium]|nr:hypothetical protein [Acidobacteriota bacterium]
MPTAEQQPQLPTQKRIGTQIILIPFYMLLGICVLGGLIMYMDKPSKSPSSSANQTVSEVKETPFYIPPTPIPSSPEQKRELLKESYKVALSLANPHLNYIETSISKQKGGYALFASHEYFGRYTFSIGGNAKVVEEWIAKNRNALYHAKIVRVGVRDKQGYGGSIWFNIE